MWRWPLRALAAFSRNCGRAWLSWGELEAALIQAQLGFALQFGQGWKLLQDPLEGKRPAPRAEMAAPDYENDLDAFKKNAKQILAIIKSGEPAAERLRAGSPRPFPLQCLNRLPWTRPAHEEPDGPRKVVGSFCCHGARPVAMEACCAS